MQMYNAKKPPSFSLNGRHYKPESNWNAVSSKFRGCPSRHHMAISRHPSQHTFIVSTYLGFVVCEDYNNTQILSELSTEKMHVTSVDFSTTEQPEALITFTLGHILLIDPIKRRRGKVTWLNTQRNIYSPRPPIVCRWYNEKEFIVLFDDNTMWKFSKEFEIESERSTRYLTERLKEARNSLVDFISFDYPRNDGSPTSLWKFYCGRIRDLRFANKVGPNQSLFALITDEGQLKIFDFERAVSLVSFYSYFAGFLCMSWSSDNSVIVTGGEDDSISVWSLELRKLIHRGEGHSSWVSAVAIATEIDNSYTVWSAGQDGKLLVWNFMKEERSEIANGYEMKDHVSYPMRNEFPIMQPVLDLEISSDPLQALDVYEGSVFVCDSMGNINRWVEQEN
ncbi:unnamed protein product [Blepharisma stoltei]|uniref:Uncharacterized protein n=1 Tax=Blepharisma stoltei TaxID=1481888 RepID=A0AAU9IBJ9_9CILI|nr:unnamed protein product [Blepharisma stoltei]